MTNPKSNRGLRVGATLGTCLISVLLAGCGAEESPVASRNSGRASTQAPARATVTVTPIANLMAELRIDERVRLSEDKAPGTTLARKAVLQFFDGFARGDAEAVRRMIPFTDQYELDRQVENGVWEETTSNIGKIMLEAGKSPDGTACVLAIISVGYTYQPQLWYFLEEGGEVIFEPASSPPDIINKLYGLDPIAVWHSILEEEQELAGRPDEEVEIEQVVLNDSASRNAGAGRRGDGAPGRINPGGTPIRSPGSGTPGPSPGGG